MFFIRDPAKFPHFIHVSRPLSNALLHASDETHLVDSKAPPGKSLARQGVCAHFAILHSSVSAYVTSYSMFWDYLGSNPESLYQVMRLFSDLGTPYGFRHMHGWTGHTYRYVFEMLHCSWRP